MSSQGNVGLVLTGRDRAILATVAQGRAEMTCSCEPDLLIDGVYCSDQCAARRLSAAGLIIAAAPGPLGSRARAVLTAARPPLPHSPAGGRVMTRRSVDVRLIRHGETQTYQADAGLTARGRQQALAKGAQLATELEPGDVVQLPHAPTQRAAETAAALHTALLENASNNVLIEGPFVDPRFDNFRLWCDDTALDPTQAYQRYRAVRDGNGSKRPGWFAEMHQFAGIQASGGDPITYWLTQPVQYFEPAATAVRRFWHGIGEQVRDAVSGTRIFVSTHSGCIRAVAAAAVGHDPGEPENTEHVRIRIDPADDRALLDYRQHLVEVVSPVTSRPPWCSPASTHHREGERPHAQR